MKALVTGSIGDWITIQSFLSVDIEKIYFATCQHKYLAELCKLTYPNIETICLYDDWTKRNNFLHKGELHYLTLPSDWNEVIDLSMIVVFNQIRKGLLQYKSSPLWKLVNDNFNLPEKFIVTVFGSVSGHLFKNRNFDENDWNNLIDFLEKNDIKCVLLQEEYYTLSVPNHPRIIDFVGKTTFLETMSIMKKSIGYIGIDSCLCVLAAQLEQNLFFVKSNNGHFHYNKSIYCAPKPPITEGNLNNILNLKI